MIFIAAPRDSLKSKTILVGHPSIKPSVISKATTRALQAFQNKNALKNLFHFFQHIAAKTSAPTSQMPNGTLLSEL